MQFLLRLFIFFYPLTIIYGQQNNAGAKPATYTPSTRDTAVTRLFDKNTSIQWVKYFKGRMDDAAVADIALGFDGTTCRGWFSYAKSKIRYRLEGTLKGETLTLEERDGAKNVTGKLFGTYKNRRITCEWTTQDLSVGSKLIADEVPPGQSANVNCSDDKWTSRYITRYNGQRADMVILRGQNGSLDGFMWVESDGKTYKLKGDINAEGNYELEAINAIGKVAGQITGTLKPGQNTDCNWIGSGEKRSFNFTLKDHFVMGCYEYADHASSYDVLYPRTPCTTCNTWLDKQVTDWTTRCKTLFSAKKEVATPANRNRYRASAWPEIACWTDNIFSGYLTFTDTETDQAQGIAFNFNLKTGKALALSDLFNANFDSQKWLSEYTAKESPKMTQFANDPKYREWLSREGFPQFSIRREGLELSTLFHPYYGRQTLLVSWENIKSYLKKDNAAAEFIK